MRPQSWVAGTTNLCRGTIVYNDYVFDDHGADTGAPLTNRIGNLSPTAGDERYPISQEGTADLIRLTLKPHGKRLRVKGLMSALYERNSTVLAIAIDTDDDRSTGGGRWGDLGVSSSGWERVALPRARQPRIEHDPRQHPAAEVEALAHSGGDRLGRQRDRHERGLPRAGRAQPLRRERHLARDRGRRVVRGRAVHRARRGRRQPLRQDDRPEQPERAQDARGEGRERLPRAGLSLRLHPAARARASATTASPAAATAVPGPQLGFEQSFNFLGRYQPYGIYIPEAAGPHGIQMLFHGSGANLASLVGQPGMQARFGEELDRILVVPEGRGTEGWGSDISERDQLDVIRDVISAATTSTADRVFAGGLLAGRLLDLPLRRASIRTCSPERSTGSASPATRRTATRRPPTTPAGRSATRST